MDRMLRTALLSCLVVLLLQSTTSRAAIPNTINYQGYLTSSLGVPVNIGVPMTFRIYSAATGGSPLWSETWGPIPVTNGNFTAALGTISPLNLDFDVPYWLTIEIGTDGEMSPRLAMSTIPYAVVAAGLDSTANVPGAQISGAITGATIAGTQITGNIAGNQITGNIVATSNIVLPNSTAIAGNIIKNGSRFIHNYGSQNIYLGESSGNFTQTVGGDNTGAGAFTLQALTNGFGNTAVGSKALTSTTSGYSNSAIGSNALQLNANGFDNTALGGGAMSGMVSGNGNVAGGVNSLASNVSGFGNTALGYHALQSATGNRNIAIGSDAGSGVSAGEKNIHIGSVGQAGDSNVIRIGLTGDQNAIYLAAVRSVTVSSPLQVVIGADGQLGTIPSSVTRKESVADMKEASNTLMRLRPVTFRYRDRSAAGDLSRQYGLIAEEVAQVAPDLVAHSADGKIESVYYQFLSPMLVNEYQKQQRTIQNQAVELTRQQSRMEKMERELLEIKAMLRARLAAVHADR